MNLIVQEPSSENATLHANKITHHFRRPEDNDNTAGMQINGSNAARKSAFVGIWSILEFTTSIYDAPQNDTRMAIKGGNQSIEFKAIPSPQTGPSKSDHFAV